jgi:cytochrome oxidase Cu insertion factor (SCO1/SenC/PrrC family)
MNRIKLALRLSVVVLWCAGLASAQTKLGPKDSAALPPADLNRIQVGGEAPDFTLEDQDGKPATLSSYRGRKSVVLVFYRGYW